MPTFAWTNHDAGGAPVPVSAANALSTDLSTPVGARSSHGCSVWRSTLVMLGGEKVARTPIEGSNGQGMLVWTKDLSQPGSNWVVFENTNGNVAPAPRVAHAQCLISGSNDLYIFGGRQGVTMDEKPLNDLWRFDMEAKVWELIACNDAPEARSFHKMLAIDKKIYVFGGCLASGRSSSLHCFDTETRSWRKLSDTPENLPGRGGAGFVASSDGSSVFVVGGFCGKESNAVWRFLLDSGIWEEILPEGNAALQPFSVSCGATVGQNLVFFGGEVDPSNMGHEGAGGFTDKVVVIDSTTGAVLPCSATAEGAVGPLERGWAACAGWGENKMVVYGGLAGDDEAPLRLEDTWVLEIFA